MLLTLLQFFSTQFLYLALHLESGSFPRPLSAREEAAALCRPSCGDPMPGNADPAQPALGCTHYKKILCAAR